ncbi:MAG: gephyrin-like molybdotransferase Glp [Brooklawnia sp.]|jgi:molybdopterin molybdotransferase
MTMPISVEQYRQLLLDGVERLPATQLPLTDCLGLVTASSVLAQVATPVFTNSAMDGFAVHAADLKEASRANPVRLTVAADVPAGSVSEEWVESGAAVRIMTGAPVPPGADAVVQVEHTDQPTGAAPLPAEVLIFHPVAEGANIRLAGEDIAEGDRVLPADTRLDAAGLAAAAATGHGQLSVYRQPRVAIIATGAELVPPGQPLDHGQIPDSNSMLLRGLATQAGARVVLATRCSDESSAFDQVVESALRIADLVVTTGGVSAGTHDVVKNAARSFDLHFETVAMQPGKPQGYGHLTSPDGRPVALLALPGNPVSVFVSWYNFALPVLAKLAGCDPDELVRTYTVTAGTEWSTPKARRQYIPVAHLDDDRVVPVHRLGSGSHLIASLHLADALAIVPAEVPAVSQGDPVEIMIIRPRR